MKFDDLSEMRRLFIDYYLDCGEKNEAYQKAGFSVEGRGWKANARKLFKELHLQIQERMDQRVGEGAVLALNVVKQLMLDEEVSPAVRLNCAKDYMARAGMDRPSEARLKISKTDELSDEELDAEIRALTEADSTGKPLH